MGRCMLQYPPTPPRSKPKPKQMSNFGADKSEKASKGEGKEDIRKVLSELSSPVTPSSPSHRGKGKSKPVVRDTDAAAFFAAAEGERLEAEREETARLRKESKAAVQREYNKIHGRPLDEIDDDEGEESDDPLLLSSPPLRYAKQFPKSNHVWAGEGGSQDKPWSRGSTIPTFRPVFSLEELQSRDDITLVPEFSSPAGPGPSTHMHRKKQRRIDLSNPNVASLEKVKDTLRRQFVSPRTCSSTKAVASPPRTPITIPTMATKLPTGVREPKEAKWEKWEIEQQDQEQVTEKGRTAADEFFEMAKKIPVSLPVHKSSEVILDEAEDEGPNEAAVAVSALKSAFGLDSDSEDEGGDGENEEDRLYLQDYRDEDDLCCFCNKPLPLDCSDELMKLHLDITLKIQSQGLDSVGIHEQLSYCEFHEKESTIIPLGQRAGYPREIKWKEIWKEVEVEWIREAVLEMVKNPKRSRMFKRYFTSEGKEGPEPEWDSVWGKATTSERMSAGYYGDIGREIIKAYIFELVEWRYLPLFKYPSRYKPLGPKQFVSQVLVPEIAVMLIRHRMGLLPSSSEKEAEAERSKPSERSESEEEEAYTRAQRVRKESFQYGRVAYGDMDSVGGAIILEWTKDAVKRKAELECVRRKKGKVKVMGGEIDDREKVKEKQGTDVIETRSKSSVSIVDLTEDVELGASSQITVSSDGIDELDNSESDIEMVPSALSISKFKSRSKPKPIRANNAIATPPNPDRRPPLGETCSNLNRYGTLTDCKGEGDPNAEVKVDDVNSASIPDLFSNDDCVTVKARDKDNDNHGRFKKKRKRANHTESHSRSLSRSNTQNSDSTVMPALFCARASSKSIADFQSIAPRTGRQGSCSTKLPSPAIVPLPTQNSIHRTTSTSWEKSATPVMSQNSYDEFEFDDLDISSQDLARIDGIEV